MVGGVTPGKGGQSHLEPSSVQLCPRSDAHHRSQRFCNLRASPFAADSILEAIDAEMPLIVCITEGIPVLDMMKVQRALEGF